MDTEKRARGVKIDVATEVKIVALIARGDTQEQISQQIAGGVSKNALTAIKKRNKENLDLIKERLMQRAMDDAEGIKQKANKIISQKLDHADDADVILDKARQDWLDDKITWPEYDKILKRFKPLSVTELVSVSKEMHAQSTDNTKPPASEADLASLAAAIRSGDEIKITQAVFNAKPNAPTS